ncbi:hypothetical protein [Agarivorans sp. DSG3-1]|uniref:hypothetical protein n=1 Tax=Agarivorans sp. DSG3-1 TaxID=3342249 RepID=UPI00398E7BC7
MHFISMENFKLKWRWTDSEYCLLSESELSNIYPLDVNSASEAWDKSLAFIEKGSEFSPNLILFDSIEFVDIKAPIDFKAWLKNNMSSESIIISWQPDTAVKTKTELFIKYWDEFYYSSSDDVSIWPESKTWVIHISHKEQACFGKAKNV